MIDWKKTPAQALLIAALNFKHGLMHPISLKALGLLALSVAGIVLCVFISGTFELMAFLTLTLVVSLFIVAACFLFDPIYVSGKYRYLVLFRPEGKPWVSSMPSNTILRAELKDHLALPFGFTPNQPIPYEIENGSGDKRQRLSFRFEIMCSPTDEGVIAILEWLLMSFAEGRRSTWTTVESIEFLQPTSLPSTVRIIGKPTLEPASK